MGQDSCGGMGLLGRLLLALRNISYHNPNCGALAIGNTTTFRQTYWRNCNSCSSRQKAHPGPRSAHRNQSTVGCQGTCREKEGMENSTEEWCRKRPKPYSSRISNSSSSPHFPLALGKSHQLLYHNFFQHILLQNAHLVTVLLNS